MPEQADRIAIREIFERGEVYADRWTPEVRAALDVPDQLADVVVEALENRKSVILSGNAGDGKSHLALTALGRLGPRPRFDVTRKTPEIPTSIPSDSVVFIRDASGIADDQILAAIDTALANNATVLVTINEGPLSSLARDQHPLFASIRATLHARAMGEPEPDGGSGDVAVINLAGRQLTRSDFVAGALEKLLPVAETTPCATCKGSSAKNCPRVVGAKRLRKSKVARQRIAQLLRTLSSGGRHLSAREIWIYLIELFFGWTCPLTHDENERRRGYFWVQVFEAMNRVAGEILREFDPVRIPMAREDVALWQGRFENLNLEADYPDDPPSLVAKTSEQDGLEAFECAKRFYFFFGRDVNVDALLRRQSLAPEFGSRLEDAMNNARPLIREIVRRINNYRMRKDTEYDLWISRQHGLTASKRPSALAATGKMPIDSLTLKIPYQQEFEKYPKSGFFPEQVYLAWEDSAQYLQVDFPTWVRLARERVLTVDRGQEMLDFALELFLSQAGISATDDPEITTFDLKTTTETVLRIRPEKREIEVTN